MTDFSVETVVESSNPRSSSDYRQTVLRIWNFLKSRLTRIDRRPKIERGSTVFFSINRLMNDRPYTGYVKHLTSLGRWAVARRTMSCFRLFSSINWSNARVVTVEYSAIAKLFMQLVARKNVVQRSMIERLLVFTANK